MFLQNFAQLSYIEDEHENNGLLSWKILKRIVVLMVSVQMKFIYVQL